jgi:hypothetical protein
MARRSKLRDRVIREKILMNVRAGTTFETAARVAGIGQSTLHLWRQKGCEASEKLGKAVRLGPTDRLYLEFLEQVHEAEEMAIADRVGLMAIHAKNNWQAAAWFLERRRPEEFGRKDFVRQEVSGPGGQPIQTETKIGPFTQERLEKAYREKLRREVRAEMENENRRRMDENDTGGLSRSE